MNYLDASIRGIKFKKNKSQIPEKKENTMLASENLTQLGYRPAIKTKNLAIAGFFVLYKIF